jgi:hypothetical protein
MGDKDILKGLKVNLARDIPRIKGYLGVKDEEKIPRYQSLNDHKAAQIDR